MDTDFIVEAAQKAQVVHHLTTLSRARQESALRKEYQLANYDDEDFIRDTFILDDESKGPTSFLLWRKTRERVVLEVSGFLANCNVQSVKRNDRRFARREKDLTKNMQSVSLIGPGVPQFVSAERALRRIFDYCEQHFSEGVVAPFPTLPFGSVPQIRAATCYLTSNRNRQFPGVPVPRLIDPFFNLSSMVTSGRARFTADNIVEYEQIVVTPESQVTKRVSIPPDRFRPGQIVEVGLSFRIFESGERRKFVITPVSITLASDIGVSEVSRLQKNIHDLFGKNEVILNTRRGEIDNSAIGSHEAGYSRHVLANQNIRGHQTLPLPSTSAIASSSTPLSSVKQSILLGKKPPIDLQGNVSLDAVPSVGDLERGFQSPKDNQLQVVDMDV